MDEIYILFFRAETDNAVGVSEFEDGDIIWLPKSQIEYFEDLSELEPDDEIEIEIPDWLATDKGLT